MYLNSNVVLITIVLYQCLTICNSQFGKPKKRYVSSNSDGNDCYLSETDAPKKPMALERSDINSLICPDHNGHVNVKHNKHFKLSCENGIFVSPAALKQTREVSVKCKKGNTIEYQGRSYEYEEFKCNKTPESKAKVTKDKCQESKLDEHTKKNAAMAKYKVVMVRHGESEWNQKNLFCGWYDASLSSKGDEEAANAGKALKQGNYKFDVAHTSVLKRAQNTLGAILKELGQENIPITKTWRLNERHYGSLTGLNKAETAAKYGEEQVQIWRRSYDTPPPPMDKTNPYYEQIVNDIRYKDGPAKDEFPMFESLKLTIKRTLPYWNDVIIPQLKEGKQILIAAHGNSLRGIVKHLDNLTEDQIMNLNLPTGIPFEYELDENFKPVVSMKFLGDEETVKKAIEAVAAQGKVK